MRKSLPILTLTLLLPVIALAGRPYTEADFQQLKAVAQKSIASYTRATVLRCKDPSAQKPSLREEIASYLQIADQDLVPPEGIPVLAEYSKAFLPLLETSSILSPRLNGSDEDNFAIMTLIRENRPVIFKNSQSAPRDPIVETYRGKMPLSYVMLLLLDKIQVAQTQCGMTAAENDALYNYIGFGFTDLNRYLRGKGPKADDLDRFELVLNRALAKIADYKGYVYRSTTFAGQKDMPESVYREHKTGSFLTYAAFTSTSPFLLKNANVIIYSLTGKNVSALNDHEAGEVLFRSGSQFQVLYNSCEAKNTSAWQSCNVLMTESSNF